MTRRLCLVFVVVTFLAVASPGATAGASSRTPRAACNVLAITALGFHPRHVAPGGSSVARLTVRNCTRQPQHATLTWLGQFVGPDPGIPSGCPAIDPFATPADFAPRGTFHAHLGFVVFSSCTASALAETARLTGPDGTVLAEKTVELRIS